MHKVAKEELWARFKLGVLELAGDLGVTKICKEFNLPRSSFKDIRSRRYRRIVWIEALRI